MRGVDRYKIAIPSPESEGVYPIYALIEMKDRLKASELLGKCQGDFIDRQEITTLTPPNINVVIVESKQTIA